MMHTSIYHAGCLTTHGWSHNEGQASVYVTRKVIYTHTLRNSTASHSLAAWISTTFILPYCSSITAEKTVRKNKKHRITEKCYLQITVLWIHPRAWKNKSLQYNHFSINEWKYFTAWCNKSVMRLRLWCVSFKGPRVKVNFPAGPLRTTLGHSHERCENLIF